MDTASTSPGPDRITALEQENAALRDQLRRFTNQAKVTQGAIIEAASEKEAAARIAHQTVVEERATRAAVEVQGSNIGFTVVMQVLNFFLMVILLFGLFVWLPKTVEGQSRPAPTISVPGGTTVIPSR